jgi:acrylyl-CoA reductase (NADPH)
VAHRKGGQASPSSPGRLRAGRADIVFLFFFFTEGAAAITPAPHSHENHEQRVAGLARGSVARLAGCGRDLGEAHMNESINSFNAYLIEGSPGAVQSGFTRLDTAQLDAGEVLVRVRYASVNYKDALAATGRGPIIRRFPCVGGIDAVGTVEACDSERFKWGDRVIVHSHGFGVSHHGGYTAALAIDLMELNGAMPGRGQVLVNGATGGVASIAIDLLSQRGFDVVAVTRKADQATYLRALGAGSVIATRDLPLATRPLEKPQWAAAIDSLGGEALAALTRTMHKDGVIASIGHAAGAELVTSVMPFILRGVRLIGVNSDNDPALRERIWQRLGTDLRPRHRARGDRGAPRPFDHMRNPATGDSSPVYVPPAARYRLEAYLDGMWRTGAARTQRLAAPCPPDEVGARSQKWAVPGHQAHHQADAQLQVISGRQKGSGRKGPLLLEGGITLSFADQFDAWAGKNPSSLANWHSGPATPPSSAVNATERRHVHRSQAWWAVFIKQPAQVGQRCASRGLRLRLATIPIFSPQQKVIELGHVLGVLAERAVGQQLGDGAFIGGAVEAAFFFFRCTRLEDLQGLLEGLKPGFQRDIEKGLPERLGGAFKAHRQFHGQTRQLAAKPGVQGLEPDAHVVHRVV